MSANESDIQRSLWNLQGADLREAEASGRRLLREQPSNARALNVVARAHYDRGDAAEAVRLLNQAIYGNSRHYPCYDSLAGIYRSLGQVGCASAIYEAWACCLSTEGDADTAEDSPDPLRSINDNVQTPDSIAKYYAARVSEYDVTCSYMKPRYAATRRARELEYQAALQGRTVLEVACGTGHWTGVIAATARSVLATDRNSEQISVVQRRYASVSNIRCQVADAYSMDGVPTGFDAAFSHFWWSHVPKSMIRPFLRTLHSKLKPCALVIFADSLPYLERPRRLDADGNVIEQRPLLNGDQHEIIKNFPAEREIRAVLMDSAEHITYKQDLDNHVWVVTYRTKAQG